LIVSGSVIISSTASIVTLIEIKESSNHNTNRN